MKLFSFLLIFIFVIIEVLTILFFIIGKIETENFILMTISQSLMIGLGVFYLKNAGA